MEYDKINATNSVDNNYENSMTNETQRFNIISSNTEEKEINRNKPWRIVIRRNVVNGGNCDENIH